MKMNFFNSFPQYGVYILGLNLLLCGVSEGFIGFGMDGFEEMFPLLMLGGMNGGQSNYVRPKPIAPTLPPTPPPPMVKPPSITWRWVPNTRYTWPLFNNMQWPQYNPYVLPLANNAMAKTGSAFNTNTISGTKASSGNAMPVLPAPNAQMISSGGPVPPAAGLMNGMGMGLAGSNMAAANQMTWNTQTTSKGSTPM
uniref:Proline-rich protein 3 n=1 Tax=Lottia gigantea TaxID=225164 RepID=PRP3_LOTGI|nr:RecName: Full=Proline-rich protein 3; AltName: Full=Uncharacterized shell protein 25; Short=LUSP-25; Flags: Precursor [Lottia gigantea]